IRVSSNSNRLVQFNKVPRVRIPLSPGNTYASLGHTKNEIQPYAEKIESLSNITSIATGWHHSVALNDKGEVFIWGSDPSTQNRESTGSFFQSIKKVNGLPQIKEIACGSWHTLAIDSNGETWGWGKNHFGMLGTGDTLSTSTPIKLKLPVGICAIGGGCFQSLAVDTAGNIWTMGDNPSGQQGQGNYDRLHYPKKVLFEDKLNIQLRNYKFWISRILKYLLFITSIFLNIYLYKKLKLTMAKKS
ncbi:hypothetical protein N9O59_01285, partial [Schleiferiaceae bacterium]|nr:hypothetical protein [Schleiferiaceae bacterium]